MKPTGKLIFVHKNPTEPLTLIDKAVHDYGCSGVVYEVMEGTTNKNLKVGSDKYAPAILAHGKGQLVFHPLHVISGRNGAKEAKRICSRIEGYVNKSNFGALFVQIPNGYRGDITQAQEYVNGIKKAYPALDLVLTGVINPEETSTGLAILLSKADVVMPIILWKPEVEIPWDEVFAPVWRFIRRYNQHAPIYPVFSVVDVTAQGYYRDSDKVKEVWQTAMMDSTIQAVGIWNWSPDDDVVKMTQDGDAAARVKQLVKGLVFKKISAPVVIPEPENVGDEPQLDEPEPELTLEEKVNIMWEHGKANWWWGK